MTGQMDDWADGWLVDWEKGMRSGVTKGGCMVALRMLSAKIYPKGMIARITGLSKDKVKWLAKWCRKRPRRLRS